MRKSYKDLEATRARWLDVHLPYSLKYWTDFDYEVLSNIMYRKKRGYSKSGTYNDCIIMADTETSKPEHIELDPFGKPRPAANHVVCWSLSIRAHNRNVVTLWGRKPSECVDCIEKILDHLKGDDTYIYFHNLSYDWTFLRQFFFKKFGYPSGQLNTKPHYPLFVQWKDKGLTLKDSYILAQRSIEKWANDLDVEHKKAVGSWDYDKIRHQSDKELTEEELKYIECDVLAGVECIDATCKALNKSIYSIPYTATGIVRMELRERGKHHNAHEWFLRCAPSYRQHEKLRKIYHGGFTHANRFLIDILLDYSDTECNDFASSYPFTMIAYGFPDGQFMPMEDCHPDVILRNSEKYCYMFKLTMLNFKLKDPLEPMPYLQYCKLKCDINISPADIDNGRVVQGGYMEMYTNEIDLQIIMSQYDCEVANCTEVEVCGKKYLPRWITDYVYELFRDKCQLKGGDPVLYAIQKAKLNSLYGMSVQRVIQPEIKEIYDYDPDSLEPIYKEDPLEDPEAEYNKYVKRRTSILPYTVGVWVTSYAARNLILGLGSCVDDERKEDGKRKNISHWLYCDTDSVYSDKWNRQRLTMYNTLCQSLLRRNGYGPVEHNDKEYWLGVAEYDKTYTEFKMQGAKRYCGRDKKDGELHITVAGVPKRGALCLKDDINNFTKDCIFDGETTGKLAHYYIYSKDIYIDEYGDEIADSIDLQPCDYELDQTEKWDFIETEEVIIQVFEEGSFI